MPSRRTAPSTHPPLDDVGHLLAEWQAERPDLDVSPVAIVQRVGRLAAYYAAAIERLFKTTPISSADFAVLANLRRAGKPFQLTQRQLMDALALTSGTISVRIARLARQQLVRREPDPEDGRSVIVTLTDDGERLFDTLAPDHLANEARLVAALTSEERDDLARLLQRLLVEYDTSPSERPGRDLGLSLAPSHVGQQRRHAVGLPPSAGLLVDAVVAGSPAARSGIRPGDLLVASGKRPLHSLTCMTEAIAAARGGSLRVTLQRGDDRIHTLVPLTNAEPTGVGRPHTR